MTEFFAFLDYKNDITYAMTACYNYGFQRGRKYERNRGGGGKVIVKSEE